MYFIYVNSISLLFMMDQAERSGTLKLQTFDGDNNYDSSGSCTEIVEILHRISLDIEIVEILHISGMVW